MPCRLASSCPLSAALLLGAALLSGPACRSSAPMTAPAPAPPDVTAAAERWVPPLIPLPAEVALDPATRFDLTVETTIYVEAGHAAAQRIGQGLAALLATTRRPPPAVLPLPPAPPPNHIVLTTTGAPAALGPEGYTLTITPEGATIRAPEAAGLFYGIQTLRQLLPPHVEYRAALPRPLWLPTGRVVDRPRFAWRGAMLDVARHFRPVDEVKRYVELMALHKLNRLHLHLADDQGWRLEIEAWPALTAVGASTQVGGGPGGFYTQADYADIVRYAADRFITVVPEIDVPGHVNAALASVPALNCDGVAPPLFTGIEVGFSALCLEKDVTYRFLDDVVREIAALTPGPYFHFGGDEVRKLSDAAYAAFVRRMEALVAAHGKQPIAWDEVAPVARPAGPRPIVQWWRPSEAARQVVAAHAAAGGQVIVSPADRFYLDMRYDSLTVLGLRWAGLTSVEKAYLSDPAALLPGVPPGAVLGVEAPLWAETTETMADVEHLAFPRLAGVAELGWSPAAALDWAAYRVRLGLQAPRWTALGLRFYRAPEVDWRD